MSRVTKKSANGNGASERKSPSAPTIDFKSLFRTIKSVLSVYNPGFLQFTGEVRKERLNDLLKSITNEGETNEDRLKLLLMLNAIMTGSSKTLKERISNRMEGCNIFKANDYWSAGGFFHPSTVPATKLPNLSINALDNIDIKQADNKQVTVTLSGLKEAYFKYINNKTQKNPGGIAISDNQAAKLTPLQQVTHNSLAKPDYLAMLKQVQSQASSKTKTTNFVSRLLTMVKEKNENNRSEVYSEKKATFSTSSGTLFEKTEITIEPETAFCVLYHSGLSHIKESMTAAALKHNMFSVSHFSAWSHTHPDSSPMKCLKFNVDKIAKTIDNGLIKKIKEDCLASSSPTPASETSAPGQ